MSHFFRNIYLALIALSITHNACIAMEEEPIIKKRSSASNLSSKDLQNKNVSQYENRWNEAEIAPTCSLVYCCLDFLSNCCFPKDKK